MNRFIIVDGLPFLYANGKAYRVRWNEEGFTVGAEVELASVPSCVYSEISIKAKCADNLDSIQDTEQAEEPVQEPEEVQEVEQEAEQAEEPIQEPEEIQEEKQETNPAEEPVQEPEDVKEVKSDFENMKLDELKKYASDNGIALKGARTKAEIIEVINNASNE